MKTAIALVLLVVGLAAPASAEKNIFALPKDKQKVAERMSDVAVWTNIVAQFVSDIRADDKQQALVASGCRWGIALGVAGVTKKFVHRMRPDGSNDRSFLSGHTLNAFANTRWNVNISIPIAALTGIGRNLANKHWPTDVLAGMGAGLLTSWVCGPHEREQP